MPSLGLPSRKNARGFVGFWNVRGDFCTWCDIGNEATAERPEPRAFESKRDLTVEALHDSQGEDAAEIFLGVGRLLAPRDHFERSIAQNYLVMSRGASRGEGVCSYYALGSFSCAPDIKMPIHPVP